ncbi:MAG: hypothetical protein A3I89_00765 [Candidatus Harrisonbacteria bacterium RIFCSPLOWO2_02_FULL_41_11]|uniref:Uncharacterized protein n=1 Tax=Candidatus Harrisonbacteria bacterium RIFCSPHIGHO2_02_FULL_42_16 TaxID=1798404 RepID=A0A1G1ZGW5_9BACT|nr:MAG: hypothetical protein A3B92_03430 [Candidatus Harrisonbacteria bacterium RIFCSPHIGHO2_02_FULL_42_16]OGY66914.1 MAG: hypothetical protein A3I89_00765 [Candidatus Harrisonbacteria bacterium RIFCSPLOWO2_02_FULL_41_11]
MFVCLNCKGQAAVLPDANLASELIAETLIQQCFKLNYEEVRFLRKSMRLREDELALLLRVKPTDIFSWENKITEIDSLDDLRLRLLIIDIIKNPLFKKIELKLKLADIFGNCDYRKSRPNPIPKIILKPVPTHFNFRIEVAKPT